VKSDHPEQSGRRWDYSTSAQKASRELESLRNKVAHAQCFVDKDRAQVARLAGRMHHLLEEALRRNRRATAGRFQA
jgi:uncharacterized coiled-coil protein SlyX